MDLHDICFINFLYDVLYKKLI